MKIRTLKKFAKATHPYGWEPENIRKQMDIARKRKKIVKRRLRFWTHFNNYTMKFVKKLVHMRDAEQRADVIIDRIMRGNGH